MGEAALPVTPYERRLLWLLLMTAVAVRCVAVATTIDSPGDGPTRACMAYGWSQHPAFITYGLWLPLGNYVCGLIEMAWPEPAWVTRCVNVVAGSVTVPVYWALVARTFDKRTAWACAAFLALLPLHVTLSASSLSEPLSLLLVLSALALLCRTELAGVQVAWATVALVAAETSRYEAWLIVVVCLLHIGFVTRRPRWVLTSAACLSLFPIAWLLMCARQFGSFWFVAEQELRGTEEVQQPWSWAAGLSGLLPQMSHYIGWPLVLLVVFGLVMQWRSRSTPARWTLYVLACMAFVGDVHLDMVHAGNLWERQLQLLLVFGVPFGLAQVTRYHLVVWCALMACVAVTFHPRAASLPVSRRDISSVLKVIQWQQRLPNPLSGLLLTRCDWNSTYFALYDAPMYDHQMVVSGWISDQVLADFIRTHHPAAVVTQPGDENYLARIETVGHCHIDRSTPLTSAPPLVVYPVRY